MVASPTHRALRRTGSVVVILALLVGGCSASDDPGEGAPPGTGDSSGATAPTPTVVEPADETLDAITSAGIRIVAADGSTAHAAAAPATGVEFTVDQLSGLLVQAESQSGTPGATLDGLAPSDIPMSALLAAYARGVDTPAAVLAASLLEPQDLTHPETVVFPALVGTLFASDLAHAVGDQDAASLSLSAYTPAAGLCTDATGALYKGINAVFDALHVNPVNLPSTGVMFLDGLFQGFANMVVAGVNYLVEAGRTLVIGVARYTVAKVLAIVAKVAALAAMIGNFTVALAPVHVKVVTDRGTVPKGTPGRLENLTATASATIDIGLGKLEWPEWFENCAQLAGAPLPKLKPEGEKITWSIRSIEPGLLFDAGHHGSPDPLLLDGGPGTAVGSWDLVTGTEPANAKGDPVSSNALVVAEVERSQVRKLRDTLVELGASMLTNDLPPIISGYLHDALVGAGKGLTEGFVKLLSATGWKSVEVTYREPGKKQPPRSVGEVWEGSWVDNVYDLSGTFRLEVTRKYSSMTGSLQVIGSPCVQSGELRAEVLGDQVEFGLVVGGVDQVTFSGVIEGTHVAGTFTSGPGCGNGSGPWAGVITPAG